MAAHDFPGLRPAVRLSALSRTLSLPRTSFCRPGGWRTPAHFRRQLRRSVYGRRAGRPQLMAGYLKPVSESERAAAAEARQATLDKLHTQLSDGILALNDPQAWKAWPVRASIATRSGTRC